MFLRFCSRGQTRREDGRDADKRRSASAKGGDVSRRTPAAVATSARVHAEERATRGERGERRARRDGKEDNARDEGEISPLRDPDRKSPDRVWGLGCERNGKKSRGKPLVRLSAISRSRARV